MIISGFYNFLKAIPVIYKLFHLYFNETREGGIILDQFLCPLLMILMCFMNWEEKKNLYILQRISNLESLALSLLESFKYFLKEIDIL